MNKIAFMLPLLTVAASASADATHSDIYVAQQGGTIVTGTYDGTTAVYGQRVFEGELDAGAFVSDPGFNALGNTSVFPTGYAALPGASGLGFNIVPTTLGGQTRNLWHWGPADASADVDFTPVPGDEHFLINKPTGPTTSLNAVADGGTTAVPGFTLDTTDATGALHEHINFFVGGDGAFSTPAAEGFYLVSLELTMNGLARSEPFWVVFHLDGLGTEDQHEAAVEWVEANLVPEPGLVGLLTVASLALLRRRRA